MSRYQMRDLLVSMPGAHGAAFAGQEITETECPNAVSDGPDDCIQPTACDVTEGPECDNSLWCICSIIGCDDESICLGPSDGCAVRTDGCVLSCFRHESADNCDGISIECPQALASACENTICWPASHGCDGGSVDCPIASVCENGTISWPDSQGCDVGTECNPPSDCNPPSNVGGSDLGSAGAFGELRQSLRKRLKK